MKTSTLSAVVLAATLAFLLAVAPAYAAPAEDAVAATTPSSDAPAGLPGFPGLPDAPPSLGELPGPIGKALGRLVKEAPERLKTLQDTFHKNADTIRDRVRGGLTRIADETTTKAHHRGTTPSTTTMTSTTTTTSAPPATAAARKPPTGLDAAGPTTPANVPDTTTLVPDSRTLIGAPTRCGPNMKADRNGRCREVFEDDPDDQS